jgi:hypothetical protein
MGVSMFGNVTALNTQEMWLPAVPRDHKIDQPCVFGRTLLVRLLYFNFPHLLIEQRMSSLHF